MYFRFLHSPLINSGVIRDPRFPSREISFTTGQRILVSIDTPILFPVDNVPSDTPADYLGMVIPVLSNRLLDALVSAGVDNIQSFPAVLHNEQTGDSWSDFQAVNILGLIHCANLRKSRYEEIGGGLLDFEALVVDEQKAKGNLLFRLGESPSTIIAEKRIGDFLYSSMVPKMTGFMFRPAFEV